MANEQVLKQVCARLGDGAQWVAPVDSAVQRFEITSPETVATFLAQIAHESAELTRLEESLSYTAARSVAVWPGRLPTLQSVQPFERAPERLANRVHANRLGNGSAAHFRYSRGLNPLADDHSGDGDGDDADFVRISTIINGGTQGLDERRRYWERAKAVLR